MFRWGNNETVLDRKLNSSFDANNTSLLSKISTVNSHYNRNKLQYILSQKNSVSLAPINFATVQNNCTLKSIILSFLIAEYCIIYVWFEVLTAVVIKSLIFWDITPWSPLRVKEHFGGTSSRLKLCLLPGSYWYLCWLILRLWRWRRHVPPKRQLAYNGLHGVVYQKIELFYKIYVQI
jgi:hypothetical protein